MPRIPIRPPFIPSLCVIVRVSSLSVMYFLYFVFDKKYCRLCSRACWTDNLVDRQYLNANVLADNRVVLRCSLLGIVCLSWLEVCGGGGREGARGEERNKNKQVIVEALYLGLEDLEVSNNNNKIVNKEKKGSS